MRCLVFRGLASLRDLARWRVRAVYLFSKSANQEASALRFVLSHPWRKNKGAPRMGQPASRRVEICGIPPLAQKQERAKDGATGQAFFETKALREHRR